MNHNLAYWLMVGALCLCFPPLLGCVIGIGAFCLVWWVFFKLLGG